MKYMFDRYLGYDRKTAEKLMRLPSRWVTVQKSPPAALYANGSFLINC